MYFAVSHQEVDSVVPKLLSTMRNIDQTSADVDTNCYALVDCAFDESSSHGLAKAGLPVFNGTALASLADISPRVLPLDRDPLAREAQLRRLIKGCAHMPMLSFIVSRQATADLTVVLANLVLACTDDGFEWPLRFADTRVLPCLLDTLTLPQKQAQLGGIDAWLWPDRQGDWQISRLMLPLYAERIPLMLSERQFNSMVTASEPDAILAKLHEASPELLEAHPPHENHALVADALKALQVRRLDGVELQLRWAALALLFSHDFMQIPEIADALDSAKSSEDLLHRCDALPEHVWARVEVEDLG